jgi:hypothetical protein
MHHLASYQSLLKELEHIYQALINKEEYGMALKALDLSARLLQKGQADTMDIGRLLSQLTDAELEKISRQFSVKVPKSKKKRWEKCSK